MFDDSLWLGYAAAPPGAFFMDDVWISGRLAHAKVKRFVVPPLDACPAFFFKKKAVFAVFGGRCLANRHHHQ
jgi:hypothetical protein